MGDETVTTKSSFRLGNKAFRDESEYALEENRRLYEGYEDVLPPSQYEPWTENEQYGWGEVARLGRGGEQIRPEVMEQYRRTLRGDERSAGNPYLQDMVNQTALDVSGQMGRMAGGGRYGAGIHQTATANAVGRASTELRFANDNRERAYQQEAMMAGPQFSDLEYGGAYRAVQAGEAERGDAQRRRLQELSDFFWPQQAFQTYQQNLAGNPLGAESNTNTQQTTPFDWIGTQLALQGQVAGAYGGASGGGGAGGGAAPQSQPYQQPQTRQAGGAFGGYGGYA